MTQEFIIHNGVRMIKGWPAKIEAAQLQDFVLIAGVAHPRVCYGDENYDWGADHRPCPDCREIEGQFHVFGCEVEQCPACGTRLFSCDCDDGHAYPET